ANSRHAFLGGGENNSVAAAAFHSFLGGGAGNTIQVGAEESFLGGGYQNQIQTDAPFAVLGGGYGNWIGAEGGMVPGGRGNYVGGMYSFAAGYRAKAPLPGCFVWADANGVDFNTGVANSFNVRATGGLYFVTSINPDGSPASTTILRDGNLTCDGILTCKSLTVLGGADLAEPFAMSEQNVAPGTVVVIDGKNPGRLKLSTLPCDRKVAGVVSGANGIQPGVSMIQAETLEAGRNVALSGRVYVLADAASGSIEPGDLLTTSATPGHAMKVTDFYRAQGAILGKAMSGLKEGKGMVLVLVTLQ
ncbi:MAG: hypothetical protein NT167_29570, partial [Verrucomicrobia bacterium]|nr:hypothetical protein [Verrucomicrobiota bacterium]